MYIPNLETLKRVIKSIALDPDVLHNVPIAPEIQRNKPKFPKGTKVFY